MTRIRYQGRDYHTPVHMPVQIKERIEGMETRKYNKLTTLVMMFIMSAVLWAGILGSLFA